MTLFSMSTSLTVPTWSDVGDLKMFFASLKADVEGGGIMCNEEEVTALPFVEFAPRERAGRRYMRRGERSSLGEESENGIALSRRSGSISSNNL